MHTYLYHPLKQKIFALNCKYKENDEKTAIIFVLIFINNKKIEKRERGMKPLKAQLHLDLKAYP